MTKQLRGMGAGRPRAADGPVYDKVVDLESKGWTPKQVWDELTRLAAKPDGELAGRNIPGLRTIENYMKVLAPLDKSGRWSLREADATDVRPVLETLAAVMKETRGRRAYLTREETEWIIRIRRAVPNLPAWRVYQITRSYMHYQATGADAAAVRLDVLMALLSAYPTPVSDRAFEYLRAMWWALPSPRLQTWPEYAAKIQESFRDASPLAEGEPVRDRLTLTPAEWVQDRDRLTEGEWEFFHGGLFWFAMALAELEHIGGHGRPEGEAAE